MAYTPSKDLLSSSYPYTPTNTISPFYYQNFDGDPYYESVVLALHMYGAEGGTNFIDTSKYAHAVSPHNQVHMSNAQSKFGTSAYFDGVTDRLEIANNGVFALPGDSTLEMFFYIDGNSPQHGVGNVRIARLFGYSTDGIFDLLISGDTVTTGTGLQYRHGSNTIALTMPIAQGVWHHIAAVRAGNDLKLFFNGTFLGSTNVVTGSIASNLLRTGATGIGLPYSFSFNGYIDDLRLTNGVARYDADFIIPAEEFPDYTQQPSDVLDPHFDKVTLLLHTDGVVGATTFPDSSPLNNTITASNAVISNTGSEFGQSVDVTIVGSKLSVPIANVFDFLEEDWTVEFYANVIGVSGYRTFITTLWNNSPNGFKIYSDNGNLSIAAFDIGGSSIVSATTTYNPAILLEAVTHHIAVQRSGNTVTIFLDGIKIRSNTLTGIINSTSSLLSIGVNDYNQSFPSHDMNGYMDEIRITRGVARYSQNFATQTAPLSETGPNSGDFFGNVTLLLHGDNVDGSTTIIDSSIRSLDLPSKATVYNSNLQYAVNGSSIFMNAEDMSIPDGTFDFGFDDFTIEFWVKIGSAATIFPAMMSSYLDSGTAAGFLIRATGAGASWVGNGELEFQATPGGGFPFSMFSKSTTIRDDAWHHVAVVREGLGHRMYIDGVLEATHEGLGINEYRESGTNKLNGLGAYPNYSESGYYDEIRITKGVARYIYDFPLQNFPFPNYLEPAPMTIPEDAMLGRVSFLMHAEGADGSLVFTDSSRYDASATLHGNASISTTTSAVATSSLYLDGVNSRVSYPDNPAYHLSNKNFTIEFWMFPLSNSNDGMLMCQMDDENGNNAQWMISVGTDSTIHIRTATSGGTWDNIFNSTEIVELNKWTHVALVSNAGNMFMFIDGRLQDTVLIAHADMSDSTWPLSIGGSSTGVAGRFFHGYIDEVRITKDQAIYKEDFALSYTQFKGREDRLPSPLGDISRTTLMLNVNETSGSTTVDDSLYENTITSYGNPVISTAIFNTDSISSMQFDGSGDYLAAPQSASNFGTQDFVVEFWVSINMSTASTWPRVFATSEYLVGKGLFLTINGATTGWGGEGHIYISRATNTAFFGLGSRSVIRGTGWHHISFSRKGLDTYLYIDGYMEDYRRHTAVADLTSDFTNIFSEQIGGNTDHEAGNLDGLRISIGGETYTEDFIPNFNFSLDHAAYDYDQLFPYRKLVAEPSKYVLEQRLTFSAGDLRIKMSGDGNTIVAAYPNAAPTSTGKVYYSKRTSGVWSAWVEIILSDIQISNRAMPKHVNEDGSRIIISTDVGASTAGGTVGIYDWNGTDYVRTNLFFDATDVKYDSSDPMSSDSGNMLILNSHAESFTEGTFSIYNLNTGVYIRDVNTSTALGDPTGGAVSVDFQGIYPVSINEILIYSSKLSRYVTTSISNDVITYEGLIPLSENSRIAGFDFALDVSNFPVSVKTIDKDGALSSSAFTVSGNTIFTPIVSSSGRTVAVVNYNYTDDFTINDQYIDVYNLADKVFQLSYDNDGIGSVDILFSIRYDDEATPEDLHYDNVVLLLHMDGIGGSTTFVDSSIHAQDPIVNGATINAAEAKFNQSGAFSTSRNRLTILRDTRFDFGANDLTLEFSVYPTAYDPDTSRLWYVDGDYYTGISIGLDDLGRITVYLTEANSTWSIASYIGSVIPLNTWTSIALVRYSDSFYLYLDGVGTLIASVPPGTSLFYNTSYHFVIGGQGVGIDRQFLGLMDEYRITTGIARYTEDYPIATEPFPGNIVRIDPDFDNVVLLMHMDTAPGSTTFIDDSLYQHRSTAIGDAQISLGTGSFGNSAVFDGVGDYIEVATSQEIDMGAGPFTIELDFSITADSVPDFDGTRGAILLGTWTTNDVIGWNVTLGGSTTETGSHISIDYRATTNDGTRFTHVFAATLAKDVLYNLAITREVDSGVLYAYLDGVAIALTREVWGTDPGNSLNSIGNNLKIGGLPHASYPLVLNGHIDEIRITKGIARYTTGFTPSIQAFPSEGNPQPGDPYWNQVLYASHYDGELGLGVVKDESIYNRVTTMNGGVSQTNAESQFGGGSLESLITEDYTSVTLSGLSDVLTIEMSFKMSASALNKGLFNANGNSIVPYVNSSSFLAIRYHSTNYVTTAAVPMDVWNHVAFVSNSTDTKIYLNGIHVYTINVAHTWSSNILLGSAAGAFSIGHPNGHTDEIIITAAEKYTADFTPPTEAFLAHLPVVLDPYLDDVVLLLHMDGVDGSTDIVDSSVYGNAVSATTGTPTISTAAGLYGQSLDLGSTPQNIEYASRPEFNLGTDDFTIEASFNLNSTAGGGSLVGRFTDGAREYALRYETLDRLFFTYSVNGASFITSHSVTFPLSINTWYTLAVTRASGVLRMFLDGIEVGTPFDTGGQAFYSGTSILQIGGEANATYRALDGYIDEVRITKGVARYVEDYTVATAAFSDEALAPVAPVAPATTVYNTFTLPYDDIENIEYAHAFALQYTMGLFGIPYILIGDLSLSTNVTYSDLLFKFPFDDEGRVAADYEFSFVYTISHIDDIHIFSLPYKFNKELIDTPYEFGLPYRFGLESLDEYVHGFSFRYLDAGYLQQEWAHIFGLPYSFALANVVENLFTIRYTNTALFLSDEYVFNLRSDFGLIRHRDYEFKARYVDASFVADAEYVYHFRNLLGAIEERENDFDFRYRYDYYTPVSYEFNISYHMRLANAANPDNVTTTITPDGNGGADFSIEIIDVEMIQGDYVLAIDSGSSYSSFFARFTVPETGANIVDMTLYDSSGVTVDVSFTDVLDTIKFTVKGVDIDSSISVSSYGVTNGEFSVMFNEWPNWSSYIHEDLEAFSSLVRLDSGNFKILPLQPNTCCILRSSELCILPPYSDVDNIALAVESLSLDWIEVNTAIWDTGTLAKNCSAGLTEAALTPNRTVSMLSAEIIGPGILTFDWMLEATGADSIWFEVEDLFSEHIQGTQEWESKTIDIPRGRYMIEWFYIKDELNSSPTDISAIDKITYTHS